MRTIITSLKIGRYKDGTRYVPSVRNSSNKRHTGSAALSNFFVPNAALIQWIYGMRVEDSKAKEFTVPKCY